MCTRLAEFADTDYLYVVDGRKGSSLVALRDKIAVATHWEDNSKEWFLLVSIPPLILVTYSTETLLLIMLTRMTR